MDGAAAVIASQDGYYAVVAGVGPGVHHFTYASVPATQPVCATSYEGPAAWPAGTAATATSSAAPRSEGPDDTEQFTAANAVDGNPATSWEAADANPASLTVQPAQATTVGGVRLWLGGEGPPSSVTVTATVAGSPVSLGQVTGNHSGLVDIHFATPQTVTSLTIALDGAAPDAFGATRVRLFQVEPLIGAQPLSLNTSLRFDCTAAGQSPAVSPPPIVPIGTVPLFFHDAGSDLQSSGTTEPMRVMDATPPTQSVSPFGAHYKATGGPGSGETTHFQWATPSLDTVGLHQAESLRGYAYSVYVLVSFPGVQPAGVASLHVNVDRIAADGTRTALGRGTTPIPQGTLNQELDVTGEVPVDATLATGDRLVADVFIDGQEASTLYFSYDDGVFASGLILEPVDTGPGTGVFEAPWTPMLLLVAGIPVAVRLRRRRRRGQPATTRTVAPPRR
jgi:hypothetical protein